MSRSAALKRTLCIAIVAASSTACVAGKDKPPLVTVVSCGTNAPFSREDQARVADELEAMPAGSIVADRVVPDWARMRAENQACGKK
jgi:hypothetical protein